MPNKFLKWTLPMTLATLVASAEQLNFNKNLPLDRKEFIYNEPLSPSYDNRISFGTSLYDLRGGVTYEHIKPSSPYVGIGTFADSKRIGITAMGGYNVKLSEKDTLRPAAGICLFPKNKHTILPIVAVGYEHAFNDVFSLGANAASIVNRDFNITVGVPFTFHLGAEKRWNICLTPYFHHTEIGPFSANRTSVNLAFGYRF